MVTFGMKFESALVKKNLVADEPRGPYKESTKRSGFFENEGKEGHTSGYHL